MLKQRFEIGTLNLVYDENSKGTLEMKFDLDIDITKEDIDNLRKYLVEINNILIPLINKKLEENEDN